MINKTLKIIKFRQVKAFTLIELLVVLSIIALLSVIMISGSYSDNKAKNALMVDMDVLASNIRDMQNKSASFVKDNYVNNVGYGMFFDLNNPIVINSFYKTSTGDFVSSGVNSELPTTDSLKPIDDFIFETNDYLKRICLNGCGIKTTNKLAIYYLNPRPYAYFSYSDDGLNYSTKINGNAINQICLEVSSRILPNDIRHLDIYYIGQISFAYGPCQN